MDPETEVQEKAPVDELKKLESEIDAAIEASMTPAPAPAGDAPAPVAEDLGDAPAPDAPEGDEADDGPARDEAGRFAPKEKADDTPPVAGPSDAVIERAVKLGFSLAQAKQFGSEDLLVATCDRIEGPKDASGKAGSPEGAGQKAGEAQPAAPDEEIPDLDESEFDPRLVKAFKALKGRNERQTKELAELRGGRSKDWFATKLEGVKDLTRGEATKVAGLREKFDVLQAGYKAAGKNVPDDAIFSEAAELTLGTKRVRQEEAATKRSGQRISRPTGRGVETKSSDPWRDVASEIDRKYFAKP